MSSLHRSPALSPLDSDCRPCDIYKACSCLVSVCPASSRHYDSFLTPRRRISVRQIHSTCRLFLLDFGRRRGSGRAGNVGGFCTEKLQRRVNVLQPLPCLHLHDPLLQYWPSTSSKRSQEVGQSRCSCAGML